MLSSTSKLITEYSKLTFVHLVVVTMSSSPTLRSLSLGPVISITRAPATDTAPPSIALSNIHRTNNSISLTLTFLKAFVFGATLWTFVLSLHVILRWNDATAASSTPPVPSPTLDRSSLTYADPTTSGMPSPLEPDSLALPSVQEAPENSPSPSSADRVDSPAPRHILPPGQLSLLVSDPEPSLSPRAPALQQLLFPVRPSDQDDPGLLPTHSESTPTSTSLPRDPSRSTATLPPSTDPQ